MSTFSIQHGATPLCAWNLETGQATTHSRVVQRDGVLVLSEDKRVGFLLEPVVESWEHRLFIGDVSLNDIVPTSDDASGILVGERLFWRDFAYFDSARGETLLVLESRHQTAADDAWATLLTARIYVVPSKLGEDRYLAMSADMNRLSHSLLSDLYGKSRRSVDIKHSKGSQTYLSHEAELQSIESTLNRLDSLLQSIARRPASRVEVRTRSTMYWGSQRLDHTATAILARRGIDLRNEPRPIQVTERFRAETFDVSEHRIIQAFLLLLRQRIEYCAVAATSHARAIASERHLRDIRLGEGATIYESVDVPRLARLQRRVDVAEQCDTMIMAMQQLPFLREVPPAFQSVRDGMFQRNDDYKTVFLIVQRFLLEHAQWYEGEEYSSITKLTWRIFEQWAFLRTVDAFRTAGVDLSEWTDVLRQNLRSRFIIDFERGLMFEGHLGTDMRLRFRYEPWIYGHEMAVKAQESLHRGRSGGVAWSPDIVIECLQRNGDTWVSVYVIVLDCKYAARVTDQHWTGIMKYLEIRSTCTGKQVVKQLWLVCPSDVNRLQSEDPSLDFSSAGPSCEADEALRFRLCVSPDIADGDSETTKHHDGFKLFAEGTLAFLRRAFGQ